MAMTWDEARNHIVNDPYRYLKRDRSRNGGIICPICKDGDGEHGKRGPTTKDGIHFTCWQGDGCFRNADVIDIIGIEYGLETYPDKLRQAAELYGIELEDNRRQEGPRTKPLAPAPLQQDQGQQEEAPDFTGYFQQTNRHLTDTDYHRGISKATLDRFLVGYDPAWRHPKAPDTVPATPRLIIPTGAGSYIARDTRPEATDYKKMKVGPLQIFNVKGMYQAKKPVFVVEGEIDALSIIDAGGEAVALGSTSMTGKFLDKLKERKPEQPFIICLDNDEAGQAAAEKLREGMKDLGITYYDDIDIVGESKDPNESYTADPAGFKKRVQRAEAVEIIKESVRYTLTGFIEEVAASLNDSFTPTGFPSVDKLLDGGFYPGLYILGAVSSLGKTSFLLQVSDNLAKEGRDVLFFSLEMSRKELIAKSLSRLTAINDTEANGSTTLAKTTRGILTGRFYNSYSKEEMDLIKKSIGQYGEYAERLYITEGVGDVSVGTIREKVARHKAITGKTPVVIVDYLQILAPYDPRYSDKQNTDKAVLELKRLSRDEGTPVIAISSFNRDNYAAPVNMAAFKESGAVEYGADVLIGLQYNGMDYGEMGESEKERVKRVREIMQEVQAAGRDGRAQQIQVKILKNRNGVKGDAILDFIPKFNYFMEPIKKADEWIDIIDDDNFTPPF